MTVKKNRTKTAATNEPRLIKKYPNRRLYDLEKRAYITLDDIKKYVLDQIPFRVLDSQTEADLTKATLFQVLTEHETANNAFFTTELLQQMIRLYHENMQTVFGRYFEQAMEQFIKQKESWSQQFERFQAQPFSNAPSSFTNPFTAMSEFARLQNQLWETLLKKPKKE